MSLYLNLAACVCGVVSGALWWWASWIPKPQDPTTRNFMVYDSEGGTPEIRWIAKRNRWAGTFAVLSSMLTAIANLAQTGS